MAQSPSRLDPEQMDGPQLAVRYRHSFQATKGIASVRRISPGQFIRMMTDTDDGIAPTQNCTFIACAMDHSPESTLLFT